MSLPLDGVRVVEYAQYVAGPLCGVLLADLGADVVKVEPPAGDGYRFVMPVAPGLGRYFVPLNRGKRSVVVDLKTDGGLATSSRLLASADVVLHNFPRKRAEQFELGWDRVHATYPKVVVGRVTSFGTNGPARRRACLRPDRPGPCRAVDGTRLARRCRSRASGWDPDGRPDRRLPARERRPRGSAGRA